jgi:signal transduction histidine kinase
LGLARDDGRFPVATGEQALLDGMLAQAAVAFERQRLQDGMAGVAALRERDRLRGALLQSVGHDLRTPLTAILAAAAELRAGGAAGLVAMIEAEGRRLDRYIADLLDMIRIEAGQSGCGSRRWTWRRRSKRRRATWRARCRPSGCAWRSRSTCRWCAPTRDCGTTVFSICLTTPPAMARPETRSPLMRR